MRPFQCEFESVGQYHDFWTTVLFDAPDDFSRSWSNDPIDQTQALRDAFDSLRNGFHFVETRIKDERILGVLKGLLDMSFEAYSMGNRKLGARLLQECEGMIWTSRAIQPAYAGEAERRVFGEAVLFKDVHPPRYDHEGTQGYRTKTQDISMT